MSPVLLPFSFWQHHCAVYSFSSYQSCFYSGVLHQINKDLKNRYSMKMKEASHARNWYAILLVSVVDENPHHRVTVKHNLMEAQVLKYVVFD